MPKKNQAEQCPKSPVKSEDNGCKKWFKYKEMIQFERRLSSATSSIKRVKLTQQIRLMQATPEFSQVIRESQVHVSRHPCHPFLLVYPACGDKR